MATEAPDDLRTSDKFVTWRELTAILNSVTDALAQQLQTCRARIKTLETFPLEYRGIFDQGSIYQRNQLVTHAGSVWIAKSETSGPKPGTSSDWQMIVKSGRDGRDLTR